MSERQIKEYYERIEKLLNGANKETYGFVPQEIKNILRSYEELQNQNQELKKQLEEYRMDIIDGKPYIKLELVLNQQKEFIDYLENEKDRLARECSQIYEDSLGKTRLVNEDIFNEVNDILQKYKSIIGVLDEESNNISS